MTRFLVPATALAAILALPSCYSGVGSLHDVHVDEKKGEWAWCLSPSGQAESHLGASMGC